jgi:4-hydroxybenzoate polyprenyltransferase
MIKDILQLVRPHQYLKNLFIFLPAFFSFKIHHFDILLKSFLAFASFCCVASAMYILNDWQDRFDDAKHPEKYHRPIASGRINGTLAAVLFGLFLFAGGSLALCLSLSVVYLIGLYVVMNIAYSCRLKHIPIIDIFIISIGFAIRLFVGAEATGIMLVNWIIVMTFLLALFLSLAKRRDDVLIYNRTNNKTRKVIDGYNLLFLNASMVMTAAIVILAYIMWSISPEVAAKHNSSKIYLTSIFVLLGIFRYMQIAFVEEKSGSPTKVLIKDNFIKTVLIGWIFFFAIIIYF